MNKQLKKEQRKIISRLIFLERNVNREANRLKMKYNFHLIMKRDLKKMDNFYNSIVKVSNYIIECEKLVNEVCKCAHYRDEHPSRIFLLGEIKRAIVLVENYFYDHCEEYSDGQINKSKHAHLDLNNRVREIGYQLRKTQTTNYKKNLLLDEYFKNITK